MASDSEAALRGERVKDHLVENVEDLDGRSNSGVSGGVFKGDWASRKFSMGRLLLAINDDICRKRLVSLLSRQETQKGLQGQSITSCCARSCFWEESSSK